MMTKRGVLFVAAGMVLAGWARADPDVVMRWNSGPPPPLHPTVIQGYYNGKMLPVVAVTGDAPEVQVDGKLKRLSAQPKKGFVPARGVMYAPGSVALKAMNANSMKRNMVLMFSDGSEVSGGTFSAQSDFSATVVPSRDYPACYVALVFFEQAYLEGTTDNPGASVVFKSIRPFVGGKENKISLTFGYLDFGQRRMGYFPLFFTQGLEIRSNQCELVARFFHHREMVMHRAILENYRAKHRAESVALKPYLMIPPIFAEGADFKAMPKSVSANFMVNEEGQVESVQFANSLAPDVSSGLRRALGGWLFLPRLKEGRPERTMVTVPIRIDANEK